jgi:hypothetical protein
MYNSALDFTRGGHQEVLKNTTEKWELFVKISIYVITLLKDKICL